MRTFGDGTLLLVAAIAFVMWKTRTPRTVSEIAMPSAPFSSGAPSSSGTFTWGDSSGSGQGGLRMSSDADMQTRAHYVAGLFGNRSAVSQ